MTVRQVLRHRPFAALLSGRTVSVLGNGLATIAITFAVLDLTGSVSDLGIVLAARSVPQVVFLLFGGVLADRLPRHLVLVVSNIVSGGTQALAAALLLTDHASIGALVAIEAVNGASAAFTFPASAGLLPQTVPARDLQPANVAVPDGIDGSDGRRRLGGRRAGRGGRPGLGARRRRRVLTLVAAACFAAHPGRAGRPDAVEQRPRRAARGLDRVPAPAPGSGWSSLAFGVINAVHAAGWYTLGPVIADETFGRQGWGFVLGAETAGMFLAGCRAAAGAVPPAAVRRHARRPARGRR